MEISQINELLREWHVDDVIGHGTFGTVYLAKKQIFSETYFAAIKIVTIPQSDAQIQEELSSGHTFNSVRDYFKGIVEDWHSEIKTLTKLKGVTNIVGVEDYQIIEHPDKLHWDIMIRMEYLTPFIRHIMTTPIWTSDALKLGADVCRALKYCEHQHILHRDIKPENIFISKFGDYKLGDFGIARQLEKTSSNFSKKGTYLYMAPEVYKGENYDHTVDIYSLGIVLYRLFNQNKLPFMPTDSASMRYSDKENSVIQRIRGTALPSPVNSDLEISKIILKACAYNPQDRYQSAGEMLERLQERLSLLDETTNKLLINITEESMLDNPISSGIATDQSINAYNENSFRTKGMDFKQLTPLVNVANDLGSLDQGGFLKPTVQDSLLSPIGTDGIKQGDVKPEAHVRETVESVKPINNLNKPVPSINPIPPIVEQNASPSGNDNKSKNKKGVYVFTSLAIILLLLIGAFAMGGMGKNNIVAKEYSVTFNTNGGSPIYIGPVEQNAKLSVPLNPTKQGSVFEGWYKNPEYTEKWDFDNDKVDDNTTLHAKWSAVISEPGVPTLTNPSDGSTVQINKSIILEWSDTGAAKYRLVVKHSSGSGTVDMSVAGVSYTFTPKTKGTWKWSVQSYLSNDKLGETSTTRNITVSSAPVVPVVPAVPKDPVAPTLVSPKSGISMQVGTSVTLQWSNTSAPKYRLVVTNNSGAGSFDLTVTKTSYTFTPNVVGNWSWQVTSYKNSTQLGAISSIRTITVDSAPVIAPSAPTLVIPNSGASFTYPNVPTLSWNSVTAPSGGVVKYYVEITNCIEVQNSGWIVSTSWKPSLTKAGTCIWRVKAMDFDTAKESGWTVTRQFTMIELSAPGIPIQSSPGSGSQSWTSAPTLIWNPMSSPSGSTTEYYVEVFNGPVSQVSGWITSTTWRPNLADNNAGTYSWHVKSIDRGSNKESAWSSTWQFIVRVNSTNLNLSIQTARFGPYDAQNNYSDQTQRVRETIVNNSVTIYATDSFFFTAGDPGPTYTKTLKVVYRNRWNEEYEVTCGEGGSIYLTRDSQIGRFIVDGDLQ